MKNKLISTQLLLVVAVAGCSAPVTQGETVPAKGTPVHKSSLEGVYPEQVHTGPFEYTVSERSILSNGGGNDSFLLDGEVQELKPNEIALHLKDAGDIDEIVRSLNATIIEQEVLLGLPTLVGSKEDGTFRVIPSEEREYLPCFLISVPYDENEDLSDIPTLAASARVKGKHEFPSKRVASLFRKILKLRLEHKEQLVYAAMNLVGRASGTTTEGVSVYGGSNATSPDLNSFWFTQNYYSIANCKGANINNTQTNERLDLIGDGDGVNIAVIDAGFQAWNETHIPGSIISKLDIQFDSVGNDYNLAGQQAPSGTEAWHGRRVASLIFSNWNNSTAVGGTAPDADPFLLHTDYTLFNTKQCIDQARAWDCKVINMSFTHGGNADYTYVQPSLNAAWSENRILVAAAGNYGDRIEYPAAYPGVIGVGAHDKLTDKATFGSFTANSWNVDIWAPGKGMAVCTAPGEPTDMFWPNRDGSSLAAALVSGVIAVAVSKGTCYNADTALDQLLQWKNTYNCGPALDAIWTAKGS